MGKRSRIGLLAVSLLAVWLAGGCSRSPEVRKQAFRKSADTYFDQGKYREAVIQYLNVLQIDERDGPAHYRLAQCYSRQGDWRTADQELLATVSLQPDNLQAKIELGNLLLSARRFKEAQDFAQDVLTRDANNVDGHILSANAYAALEDVEESLREMQAAIQLVPDQSQSYLNMALLQSNAKQSAAAEQNFQKALSLDPHSVPAHLALGNFYQQQNRGAEAEQQFRQAIQMQPKSPVPYGALARLLVSQGKRADAEQLLSQAKQAMPDVSEGYRLLGDFYFMMQDLPHAVQEYASLYAQHPKDDRVVKNYIQVLIYSKQLDRATQLNDELLKRQSQDVDGLVLRGQIFNAQERPNDAEPSLAAALKADPKNSGAHYTLGVTLASQGATERATSELLEAASLQPAMIQVYQTLQVLALRTGNVVLLRKAAEGMINARPNLPDGYLMRATASQGGGNLKSAEEDFQKAIVLAPQDSRGPTGLARVRVAQEKYAEANQLFEKAAVKNPRDLEPIAGLAQLWLTQKQPAKAAERIQQQINQVPDVSGLYLLLGQVEMQRREYDRAQQALTKAVDLDPNSMEAILALTAVHVARGSVDQATALYQRAILTNPRDLRPYLLLGTLEEAQGNWQNAEQHYQKAVQLQPGHPVAANNLAYLLLEHGGDKNLALSLAQTARKAVPDSPSTADTLAWAYYKMGVYDSAVGLLQEAIHKVPLNPTYPYHLGLVYEKLGKSALAKASLESALKQDPKSPRADEIRQELTRLSASSN